MAEMVMDQAQRPGGLDRAEQGLLGAPVPRWEGAAKVTGAAPYAYEQSPPGTVYVAIVPAAIGRGQVTGVDAGGAEALPGVLAVIHDDPRMPAGEGNSRAKPQPNTGRVYHYGQAVAMVVAEDGEVARAAARLVQVRYEETPGRFDVEKQAPIREHGLGFLPAIDKGDLDAAMAAAEVTLDETYTTPVHFPAALEPHATTAWWEDGQLTVRTSNQIAGAARKTIATALGIEASRVRVLAPFVGGGFGGKTGVGPEAVYAAIAAERVGRPAKVVLSRRQTAYVAHHRSHTTQRIRLAAGRDGRLSGIGHESVAAQNEIGEFLEPVPFGTLPLYAGENRRFRTDLVRVDLPATGAVRAPGEAVGTFGVECAMDELAHRLGIDPIELRRRNEPEVDPTNGKPFTTRRLLDCYTQGATRFGWERRDATPGSVRDGEWLIGMGMAAALRGNFTVEAQARVRLEVGGRAVIETDMTDIGTGTYTILAQVAGDMLGLPMTAIDVRLGDSDFPASAGSGGSFGAGSSAAAVALACEDVLAELALRMNAAPEDLRLKGGQVSAGGRSAALADLVRDKAVEGHGRMAPGKVSRATSQASHGAQFAEVAVNAVTGEIRVRRMLGVFDIGRVLNRRTAQNQAVGGMVWGLAYALSEDGVVDTRDGRFVNPDFGEYHVAVNADVPQIECEFIEEVDDAANPVGAKGVGELGISGAGAAVANAIFNATGVRVRDFPVTLDKLLAGLPPL
ncbi:xanthine dehydrogenase family protein molybdopterin-binding subunit [Sphingomonas aracearum]|uniref:Xanthine dehydrogenase family protein molybdopterin-binding subunit n=2 Tax=Sphingomonas aracearum TaxID=2283317 RepID=A0A369VY87_9SPHN|nr:xanthine dehydrogenase family protein molybdopterin-binding subunit [Sphingomonas aracearum]